jgi:hypothetical protein
MVPYEAVPLNDPALSAITATDATNRIVNAVHLIGKDGAQLALTENYRLKFDFYPGLSPNATSPTARIWWPGAVQCGGTGSPLAAKAVASAWKHGPPKPIV